MCGIDLACTKPYIYIHIGDAGTITINYQYAGIVQHNIIHHLIDLTGLCHHLYRQCR